MPERASPEATPTILGMEREDCEDAAVVASGVVGGLAAAAAKNPVAGAVFAPAIAFTAHETLQAGCDAAFSSGSEKQGAPPSSPFMAGNERREEPMSQGRSAADAIRQRSGQEQGGLTEGLANAIADIREKVVEEPWFGRAATATLEVTAQDIDHTPLVGVLNDTLESFLEIGGKGRGWGGIGGREQEPDVSREREVAMDMGD